MRPQLLVWLALTALPVVLGQSRGFMSLPECARNCGLSVLAQSPSPCSVEDMDCLCRDTELIRLTELCAIDNCPVRQSLFARNLTARGCGEPIRDRSREFTIVIDVISIISALFVVQRIVFKLWAKLPFGADDWFTVITEIFCVPGTVIQIYGAVPNGLGRDFWTLGSGQRTDFFRNLYALQLLYLAQVSLLKLALLAFFMRIFTGTRIRRVLIGTVIFTAIYGTVFVAVAALQCTPINYLWQRWDGEHQGECMNVNAIAWSHSSISIALDIWMLAIPLWELKKIALDWKKKVGVALMFLIGTFVTVVSIIRLQWIVNFGARSLNPTWENLNIIMWSAIEVHVGIMCACLPSLRLVLVRMFPTILGTIQESVSNSRRRSRKSLPMMQGNVEAQRYPRELWDGPRDGPKGITREFTVIVEYGDQESYKKIKTKRNFRSEVKK
ncbi:putative PTH11-typeG-protein-coupled receptor [Stachybotrys elegans]|uniref:PTH11-typeG-protein-coupled receptor n=1 Tax=Stachybotrys elegans TaxID=80388 RepID=A0A8K0T643_9HYPO|nr:putative PTH11-typeG-protein-coupled receptor [Stachybotrys elegans]